jgi:uncharacterized protein (DUF305 family)
LTPRASRRRRAPAVLLPGALLAVLGACASYGTPDVGPADRAPAGASTDPVAYHPGAPGEDGRILSSDELRLFADLPHSADDVLFMQNMIHHHAQALEMTALAGDRAQRPDLLQLAERIESTQADEILLMQRWLAHRGEAVPVVELWYADLRITPSGIEGSGEPRAGPGEGHPHGHHAAHDDHRDQAGHRDHAHHARDHEHHEPHEPIPPHLAHQHEGMAGMLTAEEFRRLEAAWGVDFDRLFLEFMIAHHEGAIAMSQDLFRSPAGGQDGVIYQFAAHVETDQRVEIDRMRGMFPHRP